MRKKSVPANTTFRAGMGITISLLVQIVLLSYPKVDILARPKGGPVVDRGVRK